MKKRLIQCDFDGTITEEDISFAILEKFADGDWRQYDRKYAAGEITVAEFNARAFGLVKAGYQEQMDLVETKKKFRAGFTDLLQLCRQENIKFLVVSNGFDFYIRHIFQDYSLDIEFYAARVQFNNSRMQIDYIGNDGQVMQSGFKESFTDKYLKEGYDITYIGDGMSDFAPARKCHQVFACGTLEKYCLDNKVPYLPFRDFHDVIEKLKNGV